MTFGSVFGRVFSPTFQPKSQAVVSAASTWWDLNGTITSCVAAYQPKGAASYAASLVNLTGNTDYDATEGIAPYWDSTNGWDFLATNNPKHLWTGITPANDQTWSMIVKFDNSAVNTSQAMAGCINTAGSSSIFYLCPRRGSADDHIYGNGGLALVGTRQASGVMAICGANGYLNAELQGTVSTGWDAVGIEIAIGGINYRSGAGKTFYTASSFDGRIQAMAIYSSDVSAHITQLTAAINNLRYKSLIVFDGNSMTDATYSSYPATTVAALTDTWTSQNFGVSGQTTIEMIADAAAQIDVLYDTNMLKNVVVFWEVANDLYFGATRADAQARMVQYCQARQAAGWKVVVLTLLPRSKFDTLTYEDDRTAINSYIRANYATFADAVADVAGDSRIGDNGDCDDTTYYTDGCHMTTAGYNIVAEIVAATINAL